MARYRKKPVEIEAVQWTEDTSMRELIDFTNGLVKLNDVDREFTVYDVQGEFYPCRDDVFASTYEPA